MTMTQLPNGRWVPAQPLPYYRDTRSVFVKIWHSILIFSSIFRRDREQWYDKFEKDVDEKWLVPVEPYTDKNGKWHYW